jgi:8-oxo-dGTP pyrophosphatase MutT (NUDIX family)/ferric iron reductase protein FhuF
MKHTTDSPNDGKPDPGPSQASPVEVAIHRLLVLDPKWRIETGVPTASPEWITGADFACASSGPFHSLLLAISQRLRTEDRKTVAASFALRFGWSASAAIAPFLIHRCVPDVGLDNISFRFRDTLFERTAIHCPRGAALQNSEAPDHPLIRYAGSAEDLLQVLRRQLHDQAQPVVEALYDWSGFSRKGSWGQITSSWASQFTNIQERLGGQHQALGITRRFFAGDDEVGRMQPRLHPVTIERTTHLYQRRASCCRYYLLPQGSLCASCPLVSQGERLTKNLDWMRRQVARLSTPATVTPGDACDRRPSARILVVDSRSRVLLFHFVHTQGALAGQDCWATPGGALEPGETFAEAGRRALFEETGITADPLGDEVAAQEFPLQLPAGETVVAEERFFLVRTVQTAIKGMNLTALEREVPREHRWWTLPELMAPEQKVFPENLITILESVQIFQH